MSSTSLLAVTRRMTIAAGVIASAAIFPTPASAAFTSGLCQGDAISGRGASFAASAHNQAFVPNFGSVFCADAGSAPTMAYESTGSGSGRRVVGARTNGSPEGDNTTGSLSRSFAPRFGMSEEPLSPADQANVNKGTDAVGDEGVIRTIPIALGSVAIAVNLPDGCSIAAQPDGTALTAGQKTQLSDADTANSRRLQLTRTQLETIFNGGSELDTWGELVAWINDGNGTAGQAGDMRCQQFPIVKIRRLDDGGTTFVLKDYLSQVNPGRGWATTYVTPDTRTWPNHTRTVAFDYNNDGDTADVIASCAAQFAPFSTSTCSEADVPLLQTTEIAPSAGNGNDDLINKVNDFDGSIGYGDLSTVRQQRAFAFERQANATDDKYWVKLQAKNGTSYVDPQSAPNGFVSGGARGSSCNTALLRNLPGGTDPSVGDWSQASATDSTAAGYGICSLTYALAFDDYATPYTTAPGFNAAAEERKARTVRDYLLSSVTVGQNALGAFDYAPLSPALQTLATNAVNQIGFNKAGDVGGGEQPPVVVDPPVVTPPGVTPPSVQPPVVIAPNNAFTAGKATNSKGIAKLTIQVPGPGTVTITGTAKLGKKKNQKVGSAAYSPKAGGAVKLQLKPTSKAAKELKKKKKLKVTLTITYTPAGGQPKSSTVNVTLKAAPAKKKKK